MIWKQEFNLKGLNNINTATIVSHVGIEFTEIGDDYLVATMPVDERTKQPMGLLHGGASVVLAETLGSVAGLMCVDSAQFTIVGVEINANHLKSVTSGKVIGTVKPVRIGRTIQVWNIEIKNEAGKMVCVSRFTLMVVPIQK